MSEIRPPDDRAMTDLAWRGYALRATVPHLAVAAAASAGLLAGRWSLAALSGLADRAGALPVYAAALVGWAGLLAVLAYRTVTFTYRLTDRAVLVDRGFLFRPEPPVSLTAVAGVTCGAGWVGRRLGVGWVQLETIDGRVVYLSGVRGPDSFVTQILTAANVPPPAS